MAKFWKYKPYWKVEVFLALTYLTIASLYGDLTWLKVGAVLLSLAAPGWGAVIDSYPIANYDSNYLMYNMAGGRIAVGQTFTGDGSDIVSIEFYLKKTGTPTGNLVAKVYAHTGTWGVSGVPDGAALATSGAIAATSLSTDIARVVFTLSSPYTTGNGTHYVCTCEYDGGDDSGNWVTFGFKAGTGHDGNQVYYIYGDTWTARDDLESIFYVNSASATAPTITTQAPTAITGTTATGNGNVTNTGGATVTAWGICWNTAGTPTTADNIAAGSGDGQGGAFTASMTGLSSIAPVYIRAYATNSEGTSYGSEVSLYNIYYIDSTIAGDGSDGAKNDINHPYKTIAQINTVLASGTVYPKDYIKFRGDRRYVGGLNPSNIQGSSGSPITFTSYDVTTDKPIIECSTVITDHDATGWTLVGSVYNRSYSSYDSWLFEDNLPLKKSATAACAEGAGYWYYDVAGTTLYYRPSSGTVDQHLIQMAHSGTSIKIVFDSDYNNNYITLDGLAFEKGAVVLSPYETGDKNNWIIQNCDFKYSPDRGILNNIGAGKTLTDITVQNCTFDYCNHASIYFYTSPALPQMHLRLNILNNVISHNNMYPDGSPWTATGADHDGIGIQNMKDSTISGNDISGSMNYDATGWSQGITYYGYGSDIYNVTNAVDNGSGLIRLTVDTMPDNVVTGSRIGIWDVGGVSAANGVWIATVINSTTVDLQSSTFSGSYTSGGKIEGLTNLPETGNTIAKNYVHDIGGGNGIWAEVANLSYNIIAHYGGLFGIACTAYVESENHLVANNVVYDGDGSGFDGVSDGITVAAAGASIANHTNQSIKNNIVHTVSRSYVSTSSEATYPAIDNNCYYDVSSGTPFTWAGGAHSWADWQAHADSHGLASDPLFLNAGGSFALATDFKLQNGNPCKDAGVDVGLTADYEGTAVPQGTLPDIGAFEGLISSTIRSNKNMALDIGGMFKHRKGKAMWP